MHKKTQPFLHDTFARKKTLLPDASFLLAGTHITVTAKAQDGSSLNVTIW